MPGFSLKAEAGTVVRVAVLGYAYPNFVDYWDGNWLNARVCAKTEGFVADYPLFVRAEEVARFLEQLRSLHRHLRGKAEFVMLEGQLRLSLEAADTLGHVQVETVAQHPSGTGAKLRFGFGTDQTFLAPLIGELADVAAAFPVRGAPGQD